MISQVAVWVKDDKVLILEDATYPGEYVLPGGRIDEGEDAQDAFARELKEEINMDSFETIKRLDVHIWNNRGKPYCAMAYLIQSDHDDIQLSHEHLQAKWVSLDEIDNYNYVWPCAADMLKKGLK